MTVAFYLSAVVAVVSTVLVITSLNAVHGLLYLIVSLFSVALIFFVLGATFAAALEVIIYAGAIMVLFIFVIMMLNLGVRTREQEQQWLRPRTWLGPSILALVLLAELVYILALGTGGTITAFEVSPKRVSLALFGPYMLGVEIASMLLLAGLVGAFHVGRRTRPSEPTGKEV